MKPRSYLCPHCGEQTKPRWAAPYPQCAHCGGRAQIARSVRLADLVVTWLAMPVAFVIFVAWYARPFVGYLLAAAAVSLAIAYAVIAGRVPLERADPHAGESIFRSLRRHYGRLRGRS